MAYSGVTYDLDLSNKTAVQYGLASGETINVAGGAEGYWPGSELEIHISVHQGGRYLDENTWYVSKAYVNSNDDLRNSSVTPYDSQEKALNAATRMVMKYA